MSTSVAHKEQNCRQTVIFLPKSFLPYRRVIKPLLADEERQNTTFPSNLLPMSRLVIPGLPNTWCLSGLCCTTPRLLDASEDRECDALSSLSRVRPTGAQDTRDESLRGDEKGKSRDWRRGASSEVSLGHKPHCTFEVSLPCQRVPSQESLRGTGLQRVPD